MADTRPCDGPAQSRQGRACTAQSKSRPADRGHTGRTDSGGAREAAVRDSDIQSNAMRYLAETGIEASAMESPGKRPAWPSPTGPGSSSRTSPRGSIGGTTGRRSTAPRTSGTRRAEPSIRRPIRQPSGKMQPSAWPVRAWQEVANDAVESGAAAHLSVLDQTDIPCRCGHDLSTWCAKASGW